MPARSDRDHQHAGRSTAIPDTYRFTHRAMATTFEIMIADPNARYAEQAAWAAFELIDRIEDELSRYKPNSDISRINNLTTDTPVKVGAAAFECLALSRLVHAQTGGAFDVTVGALVDQWRSEDNPPSDAELARLRTRTGMHLLELDKFSRTVRVHTRGVRIDLGGIGKGYAVDKAAELLQEWSIGTVLIHGGQSTMLARGAPPGKPGWPLTIRSPVASKELLAHLDLRSGAVSGSALKKGRPIIDPRSGAPVTATRAAWARAPTARRADALSTTFMVMTPEEIKRYCAIHRDTGALVVTQAGAADPGTHRILRFGGLRTGRRRA